MAALSVANPNLLDLTRRMDPDSKIASIVELLNETNEILEDMTWVEGNLTTGHRTTVRTGLPEPTWRRLYQFVQPTKSTTAQVTDNTGNLEAYAEVDKDLADLNGNTTEFRLSEDRAHIEGMNQELAETIFYGNEGTQPEAFTGLAPRFNTPSADNGQQIINGGSAGGQTDNQSIWLVVWGPNTVHGIVPKGMPGGLKVEDLGVETKNDANGGLMRVYRTHYKMNAGLTVRDWRYIVRIANIDKSTLTADAASGAKLINLMVEAEEMIPNLGMGRPVFYMSRTIRTFLRHQLTEKIKNSTLTWEMAGGKRVLSFDSIPIKRVDALSADEAQLTFA